MQDYLSYYRLYSSCIVVKGITRSTICDLQRSRIFIISNDCYSLFNKGVLIFRGGEDDEKKRFLSFLIKNDLVFESDERENDLFPGLSFGEWDVPAVIHNSILDFDKETLRDIRSYFQVLQDLEKLGCKFLYLRFFDIVDNCILKELTNWIDDTNIASYELLLKFHQPNIDVLQELSSKEKLSQIIVHSSDNLGRDQKLGKVIYLNSQIESEKCCGKIMDYQFSVNLTHFSEAINYNTCLNRKLSIDRQGNIKNCPSMETKFGNIHYDNIKQIAAQETFKKYWYIKKDQIEICKSCEFRYVCSDCRAYLERHDDIFSKPLKCGYNPESTVWEDWSAGHMKKESIEFYDLNGEL